MGSLSKAPSSGDLFEMRVERKSGTVFNVSEPLKHRFIAYLEWPFGEQKVIPEIEERTKNLPKLRELSLQSEAELRRLLYVGVTRARECLILINDLGKKKSSASTLAVLTGASDEFALPETGQPFAIGAKNHAVVHRELSAEVVMNENTEQKTKGVLALLLEAPKEHAPLYLQPSSLTSQQAPELSYEAELSTFIELGRSIMLTTTKADSLVGDGTIPSANVVGTAVHLFLGSDHIDADQSVRTATAARILKKWGVESVVVEEKLVAASDRFRTFVRN